MTIFTTIDSSIWFIGSTALLGVFLYFYVRGSHVVIPEKNYTGVAIDYFDVDLHAVTDKEIFVDKDIIAEIIQDLNKVRYAALTKSEVEQVKHDLFLSSYYLLTFYVGLKSKPRFAYEVYFFENGSIFHLNTENDKAVYYVSKELQLPLRDALLEKVDWGMSLSETF